jgi:hypothetical protein
MAFEGRLVKFKKPELEQIIQKPSHLNNRIKMVDGSNFSMV